MVHPPSRLYKCFVSKIGGSRGFVIFARLLCRREILIWERERVCVYVLETMHAYYMRTCKDYGVCGGGALIVGSVMCAI